MLHALLSLALALAPTPVQVPDPVPPAAPTREVLDAAVAALRQAFGKGETGERVRAIEAAAELEDPAVIEWIARGLDDPQESVRAAALTALRFQPHPRALAELESALRKAPRSTDGDKRVAGLILAVGQHGQVSSLGILEGAALDASREFSTRARIQALGRVRDPRAVAELVALMNKAGRGARGGAVFERDFRLSLWALTGTDEGLSRDAWMRWWNDHKRGFEVAPEPSEEPRTLALPWRRLWARPGSAPEGGGGKGRGDSAGQRAGR